MLKEAYEKNTQEKPQDFKYKVRGPPWALKIVKVTTKTKVTEIQQANTDNTQPAVNNQQSTVNNQQSTTNNQHPIVNNQQEENANTQPIIPKN